MYSENIEGLLNKNPIGFLKNYANTNPEIFEEDVKKVTEFGESFFTTFLKQGYSDDFYIELYELIKDHGYDFKKPVRPITGSDIKLNLNQMQFLPEFMNILTFHRSDDLISKFATILGKDYFLNLEKEGWFVLETLYSRALPKTIQIVSDFGLSYKEPPSGRSLLNIAERTPALTDLYWANLLKVNDVESTKLDENQFAHFIGTMEKKCSQIHSKKDYITAEVIQQIEEKFPKLDQEQKEKLLEATILSKDLAPLKKLTKLMGIRSTDPLVQLSTLRHPNQLQSKELLTPIISNPSIFVQKIERIKNTINGEEEVTDYGINLFQKCLRAFSFSPYDKFSSGRSNLINVGLRDKLSKVYNLDTIINTKTSDGKNIFDLILEKSFASRPGNNLMLGMLNIGFWSYGKDNFSFKTITNTVVESMRGDETLTLNEEQCAEVNDFLNKTWRTNGGINKTLAGPVMSSVLSDKFFIIDPIILRDKNIFTKDEKIHLLSETINALTESGWLMRMFDSKEKYSGLPKANEPFQEIVFKTLYQELLINPDKDILKLNISKEASKKISDTQFYTEMQTIMMKETLSADLSGRKEVTKKMKI